MRRCRFFIRRDFNLYGFAYRKPQQTAKKTGSFELEIMMLAYCRNLYTGTNQLFAKSYSNALQMHLAYNRYAFLSQVVRS